MHVNLIEYHVYQQLKVDEHKSKSQYDYATLLWEVQYSIGFFEAHWKWISEY